MISLCQKTDYDFQKKYSQYSSMLYRICIIYLCNKEDVEEAMQEAFIKLIYKSPKFTDDKHEKAWLIRVTTNICKDMLRSVWQKRVIKMDCIENYYDNISEIHIMEEIFKLPAKYKDVIYLYYYEEYNIKEIANILKIKESAIKMRLKRGRDMLKIELEGEYE